MWQTLEKNDVIRRLNTKEREGLTEEEVKIRQAKYGKNKLKDKKKESIIPQVSVAKILPYDNNINNCFNNISSNIKNARRK